MPILRRILVLLLLYTTIAEAWNFQYHVYDQSDGIPSLLIEGVTQANDGTMWFATRRGIITYDGTKWKQKDIIINEMDYTNSIFKHIRYSNGSIIAIAQTVDNENYILFKYNLNKWTKIEIPNDGHGSIKEFVFYQNGSEEYYILNTKNRGIIFYNNISWSYIFDKYEVINTTIINEIVYLSTTNGLFTFSIYNVDIELIVQTDNLIIFGVYQSLDNHLNIVCNDWIGVLVNNNIISYKLNVFKNTTTYRYFEYERTRLLSDRYDGVYIGTNSSLNYLSHVSDLFIPIAKLTELPAEGITDFFIDSEENIWVCTPRGVYKIQKSTFMNYSKQNGLLDNEVSSINIDNTILLGHNNGFTIFDNKYPTTIPLMDSVAHLQANSRVMDIISDNDGNRYAAISQAGIMKISGNKKQIFSSIRGDVVFGLEFFNDEILVNTNMGLCTIENDMIIPSDLYTFANNGIRDLIATIDNHLIISVVSEGLSVYKNDKWFTYQSEQLPFNNIYKLYEDGSIIYAGSRGGLLTFNMTNDHLKKQIEPFSIDKPVYMIEKDPKGRLWFGTDDGVYRWDGNYLRHYTMSHGLIGPETNRNASAIDSLGRIWIGTNKGVSVYMEEWDWDPSPPPFVYMTSIETNKDSLNPNEPVELKYNNNDLTFHYVANSFIDEDKVFVQTKLDGFEKDWQPSISSHIQSVRYTNVQPGTYTFQLKAIGIDDIFSDVVSTASITILPPYWKRLWFLTFAGIVLIGIGFTIQSYIHKRRYANLLEDEVDIRTRHLQQSRENYEMLIETAIDPILEFDVDGKLTSWNNSTCTVFNYSNVDLQNSTIELIFNSDEDFQSYWHGITSYIINDTSNVVGYSISIAGKTKDKHILNLLISTSVRVRDDQIIFTAFIKDISEQKKLEKDLIENLNILEIHREDLKRLSLEAIRAQEKERKRISQDLHDQIGQSLSALNISLELIKAQKIAGGDTEIMIQNCQSLVSSTSDDIHKFTFELRPTIIDDLGLGNAIREHLDQTSRTTQIQYEINGAPNEPRIPEDFIIIIYRIYQESLSNILKHANATKISLTFDQSDTHFQMIINDNGDGFAKQANRRPDQTGGFGILGMEERARYVGGSLRIESEPNIGTNVILELPLLPSNELR